MNDDQVQYRREYVAIGEGLSINEFVNEIWRRRNFQYQGNQRSHADWPFWRSYWGDKPVKKEMGRENLMVWKTGQAICFDPRVFRDTE